MSNLNLPRVSGDENAINTDTKGEKNINLVGSGMIQSIKSASDSGSELVELVKPSQINSLMGSTLRNIQLEEICFAICKYAELGGDTFCQEIDTNEIVIYGFLLSSYSQELDILEEKGLIIKVDGGSGDATIRDRVYRVQNLFIKAFVEQGIFDTEKLQALEMQKSQIRERLAEETKVKQMIFDKIMYVYTWIHNISGDELVSYDSLNALIGEKTDQYLFLDKYDDPGRGAIDVVIRVQGVTFESNPFLNNISVGFGKGKSKESLQDSVSKFLSWIKDTPKDKFESDVKLNLSLM